MRVLSCVSGALLASNNTIYRDAALHRQDTPTDEDMLEVYKSSAHRFHDTIVEMGGRPTRNILEELAGKAIHGENEIRIVDDHEELQMTLSLGTDLTVHHWQTEFTRFEEELDQWKEFRNYQYTKKPEPLLRIPFEPGDTDPKLANILVRLNDWREYQHYQLVKVSRVSMSMWKSAEMIEDILRKDNGPNSSPEFRHGLTTCFEDLFPLQLDSAAFQTQLTWIESQALEILAEAHALLEADFVLCKTLEEKLEQQANAFEQELKDVEARPAPSEHHPYHSAGSAQRVCHWGSAVTRLMREYLEWKDFLSWRKKQPSTREATSIRERASSGQFSDLQVWNDYVSYRRYQLDMTRTWVAGLQRLQSLREDNKNTTPREHLSMLESFISEIQADVKKFQLEVYEAELRLYSAEQQLAGLSWQRLSSATIQTAQPSNKHPKTPLIPSESEATTSLPGVANCLRSASSPMDADRTSISTRSPSSAILGLVRPSNAPSKGRGAQGEKSNTSKGQPVIVPTSVTANDATQIIEGPEHSSPDEAIGDSKGEGDIDTIISDAEDALMTDVQNPTNTGADIVSGIHCKGRDIRNSRKPGLPINKVPTSRKTRSAQRHDRTLSSRVLKTAGKKPSTKVKAFSDEQTMALLSATTVKGSRAGTQPLRRSQRLREKTAARSSTSGPQVKTTKWSNPSRKNNLKLK